MPINEKEIRSELKKFSFPRLSGTEGEEKASDEIIKRIKNVNQEPMVQEFNYSSFYSDWYPKIFALTLFFVALFLFMKSYLVVVLFSLLILFLYVIKRRNVKINENLKSKNVYVKLNNNAKSNVILISHLDSKGESMTIRARIIFTWIFIFAFAFSILFHVLFLTLSNNVFGLFELILLFVLLYVSVSFLINLKNNKTCGSLDNASGIVCVLNALKYFSEKPLERFNLFFLFTGAAERGTRGIRYFYEKNHFFDGNNTFFINFETIGKQIYLFSKGMFKEKYKDYVNYFKENIDSFNKDLITKIVSIGRSSDGYFLMRKKINGMVFCDLKSFKYAHTEKDTIDKVSSKTLKNVCDAAIKFIERVDKDRY